MAETIVSTVTSPSRGAGTGSSRSSTVPGRLSHTAVPVFPEVERSRAVGSGTRDGLLQLSLEDQVVSELTEARAVKGHGVVETQDVEVAHRLDARADQLGGDADRHAVDQAPGQRRGDQARAALDEQRANVSP